MSCTATHHVYSYLMSIQTKMAAIFKKVFGDKLVKENLVEQNNLSRLPSPDELKGKIILKGRKSADEKRISPRIQNV